jgi:hypothetical protein
MTYIAAGRTLNSITFQFYNSRLFFGASQGWKLQLQVGKAPLPIFNNERIKVE